jgi:GNAT superfamily N-acetyltransferase
MSPHPPPPPPAGVTLRPARPADLRRCQDIAVAAWTPIYDHRRRQLGASLFRRLQPRGLQRKAEEIARAFATHPEWVLVAAAAPGTAESPVVAFVTYQLDPARGVGTIGNNAVDPAWQGRGIATALYRHVLDVFRAAGMSVAAVTTGLDEAHAPARAAYARAGFATGTPSVTLYQELGPPGPPDADR